MTLIIGMILDVFCIVTFPDLLASIHHKMINEIRKLRFVIYKVKIDLHN